MAVATAMPRAVAELHGQPYYAWAFSGFVVTSLFAMVVAGEVCDARGPTRPMVVGVGLFTAGLLLAGTAVDMAVFVAARAVQGLGCGAVIVAVYVVVGRSFDDSLRPRVFSLLSSAWVLPSLVGPSVAGFLADHASWRWVFLGVSVLVVPALLLMLPSLPALEGGRPVAGSGRKRAALMVAVGLACLQYGGQRLDRVGLLFAVAGVLLVAPTIRRLLPAGTLRFARGLPTVIAMRGVLAGSFFGAETFIPLMLVTERGLTSTQAGLSLTGAALGWAAGSWYQGRPTTPAARGTCWCAAAARWSRWRSRSSRSAPGRWSHRGRRRWPGRSAGSAWVWRWRRSRCSRCSCRRRRTRGRTRRRCRSATRCSRRVTIGVGGAVYALGLRWDDGAWALRVIYAVMVALARARRRRGRSGPTRSTGGGRTAGCGQRRAASRPRVTVSGRLPG